jgi:6-phosphogluconolactonase
MSMEWIVLEDAESVALRARDEILAIAASAISTRGRFSIVLAGGTTPERAYALLADSESDWAHWHVYLGDERCLPAYKQDRNSVMASRTLTDKVPIPATQVHPIPAEYGAEEAALLYENELVSALPFDLVLLGMGEDGHTASLFPGQVHDAKRLVLPVHHAPKPPPDRVSLSPRALAACRELLFLVTGAGKKEAVRRWRDGEAIPIAGIRSNGRDRILIDRAAMPGQDDGEL